MINPELFIAYTIATTVLFLMPGPIVTLVVANTLRHGTRTGLFTVGGATVGNAVLIAAGALGLGTLLVFLSDIFDWIRWAGAAYLVWLGIREWRSRGVLLSETEATRERQDRAVFWQAFVIAVTNPKTILFYVAFFPQFLDPTLSSGPQLLAMSVMFLVLAVIFDGAYAVFSGRLRPLLQDAKRAVLRARITGTLLIGTGLALLLARRD